MLVNQCGASLFRRQNDVSMSRARSWLNLAARRKSRRNAGSVDRGKGGEKVEKEEEEEEEEEGWKGLMKSMRNARSVDRGKGGCDEGRGGQGRRKRKRRTGEEERRGGGGEGGGGNTKR
jgi:hypothetical protein